MDGRSIRVLKYAVPKTIRIPVNVAFKIQLFTLLLVLKSDVFYGQQTTASISLGLTKQ